MRQPPYQSVGPLNQSIGRGGTRTFPALHMCAGQVARRLGKRGLLAGWASASQRIQAMRQDSLCSSCTVLYVL